MKVTIDALAPDGRGEAQLDGRTVLVSQAYPTELVTLKADRVLKRVMHARVGTLLESIERVEHTCEHEFHCTGCPLLSLPYSEEVAHKEQHLSDILEDIGLDPGIADPMVDASQHFGGRTYGKQVFSWGRQGVLLGSYIQETHKVTSNQGCPILQPSLRSVFYSARAYASELQLPVATQSQPEGLRHIVARTSPNGADTQCLVAATPASMGAADTLARRLVEDGDATGSYTICSEFGDNVLLRGKIAHVAGEPTMTMTFLGFTHQIGPTSFFQSYPRMAERMFTDVLEKVSADETVVEGYAGQGALSLPLARKVETVMAIENNSEAIEQLKQACGRHQIENLETVEGNVNDEINAALERKPTTAIFDPPRKGLSQIVIDALAKNGPPRIILASCQPKTLAKTLPALVAAKYGVSSITPYNMFPRTGHFETVTVLER